MAGGSFLFLKEQIKDNSNMKLVWGVGQERPGPSYFFIWLLLGPLNSLLWYVPSSRLLYGARRLFFVSARTSIDANPQDATLWWSLVVVVVFYLFFQKQEWAPGHIPTFWVLSFDAGPEIRESWWHEAKWESWSASKDRGKEIRGMKGIRT